MCFDSKFSCNYSTMNCIEYTVIEKNGSVIGMFALFGRLQTRQFPVTKCTFEKISELPKKLQPI
jgi:hypothetical protein